MILYLLGVVTFNSTNSTLFYCSHGSPMHIPHIWVCDGVKDCTNGQDESDCGEAHGDKLVT